MNKFLGKVVIFLCLCFQTLFCSEENGHTAFGTPKLPENAWQKIFDTTKYMASAIDSIEYTIDHYNKHVTPFLYKILDFPMFFDVVDGEFPKQLEYLKSDQCGKKTIELIRELTGEMHKLHELYSRLFLNMRNLPDAIKDDSASSFLKSEFVPFFDETAPLLELKDVAPKTSVDNMEQYQDIDEVIVAFENFVNGIYAHERYFEF